MIYSTISTVTVAIVTTNLFLIILTLLLVHEELMIRVGYKLLALFVIFTVLRLVLPIELPFTKTLHLPLILSYVFAMLRHGFFKLYGHSFSLWNIFICVWCIGTVIGIIRYAILYFKSSRLITLCGKDISSSEPYHRITSDICSELRRRNRFRIIEMPGLYSPVLFGVVSPRILIPVDYNMSDEFMYYILKHEIEHHIHHDLLLKNIIKLITIVYWWNPFCILLNYYSDVILEMRIDNSITSEDSLRTANYMKCLIDANTHVLEQATIPKNITMGLLPIGHKDLHRRFYMMKNNQVKRKHTLNILLILAALSVYLLSYMFIWEGYVLPKDALPIFPVESENITVPSTSNNSYFLQNDDGTYDFYYENKYLETTDSLKYYDDVPVYTRDNCPFPVTR